VRALSWCLAAGVRNLTATLEDVDERFDEARRKGPGA
jgi:hypothetical protein